MNKKQETESKTVVIRCDGERNGLPCNNPICAQNGNDIIMKRRGREYHITLVKGQIIRIRCERCGKIMTVTGK